MEIAAENDVHIRASTQQIMSMCHRRVGYALGYSPELLDVFGRQNDNVSVIPHQFERGSFELSQIS